MVKVSEAEQLVNYDILERRVAAWAEQQPDVRALIVVGSRGRSRQPADAFSDLDLLMLTTSPERYLVDPTWPGVLGELWLAARSRTLPGDPEWEMLFDGGLKVDIVAVPAPEETPLGEVLARIPYQAVLGRGVRFLFTRRGEMLDGAWPVRTPQRLPTEGEYQNLVAELSITALRSATMIRRGELWRARYQGDAELKAALLQLLTWHTWLSRGVAADTWYNGRFVEEWADSRVALQFPRVLGGYTAQEQWEALLATIALCRWLAQECGEQLGYRPPLEAIDLVTARIDALFGEWRAHVGAGGSEPGVGSPMANEPSRRKS